VGGGVPGRGPMHCITYILYIYFVRTCKLVLIFLQRAPHRGRRANTQTHKLKHLCMWMDEIGIVADRYAYNHVLIWSVLPNVTYLHDVRMPDCFRFPRFCRSLSLGAPSILRACKYTAPSILCEHIATAMFYTRIKIITETLSQNATHASVLQSSMLANAHSLQRGPEFTLSGAWGKRNMKRSVSCKTQKAMPYIAVQCNT